MRALAKRYAKALAMYCQEKGLDFDKVYSELVSLDNILKDNPKLFEYLTVPVVPLKEKMEIASEFISKIDLPQYVKNFFLVVVEKDRLRVFPLIVEEFRQLADEMLNQARGVLRVATEISDEELSEITKAFEEKLGKKVVLEVKIDPSIIGGAVAEIGGVVFDGSVVGALKQIKEKLIER